MCVYECEESLLVLHALLLPLKGPSRPLQKKTLCCLCQRTDLCSSAWSTGSLTLRRWAGRLYLEWSGIDFSTQPAAQRSCVVLHSLSFWTVNVMKEDQAQQVYQLTLWV